MPSFADLQLAQPSQSNAKYIKKPQHFLLCACYTMQCVPAVVMICVTYYDADGQEWHLHSMPCQISESSTLTMMTKDLFIQARSYQLPNIKASEVTRYGISSVHKAAQGQRLHSRAPVPKYSVSTNRHSQRRSFRPCWYAYIGTSIQAVKVCRAQYLHPALHNLLQCRACPCTFCLSLCSLLLTMTSEYV